MKEYKEGIDLKSRTRWERKEREPGVSVKEETRRTHCVEDVGKDHSIYKRLYAELVGTRRRKLEDVSSIITV